MINPTSPSDQSISFINRDHIILAVVDRAEIVVTATAGGTITIPVSDATRDQFLDDLANTVQSNFVSVAGKPWPATFMQERT